MSADGKIIVLAFPDTFVKMSDEFMCKVLPFFGLGTRTHIKAGHAALVLIHNDTGNAQYFDFGRYVTPEGKGRVRGANTDVELEIPIQATIVNGKLTNLDEFLIWLDAHPEKTHGSGRLVASLCESIDYENALDYILNLQNLGSIPYKAFGKNGSNCARFVTETILASTKDHSIIKYLKRNKKFTPSTVGNVEKSAVNRTIFQVCNGVVTRYNRTALRENLTNYFDKRIPHQAFNTPTSITVPQSAQYLAGTGSSAWFNLELVSATEGIVTRYTESGVLDFIGRTYFPDGFQPEKPSQFIYDSNCLYCTLKQGEKIFRLELEKCMSTYSSLMQKVRSA